MIIFTILQIYQYQYNDTDEGKTLTRVFWDRTQNEKPSGVVEIDDDCQIIGSSVYTRGYFYYDSKITAVKFHNISHLKRLMTLHLRTMKN